MFAKAAITGTLQAGGPTFTAEYLVVAGGGGGGAGPASSSAAGGGAGGYRSSVTGEASGGGASAESLLGISLGTPYTVTVGAGGSSDSNGVDSVFGTIVSTGGGGGSGSGAGSAGGSGGGGHNTSSGGTGTASQGFDGGAGTGSFAPGGGGGAGEAGNTDGQTYGGDGVQSIVTGVATYRAGGGGGADNSGIVNLNNGGLGGGGAGNGDVGSGEDGSPNTGGGGGGTRTFPTPGGSGGSGVVIIRVPSSVVAEFSAGVVYNYIPLDDFNVYEITAAGVSDTVTFSQGALATIDDSLRFNDNDSAYLSRAYSAGATNTKATFAFWYKVANISADQMLYQARDNSASNALRTYIYLDSNNILRIRLHDAAGAQVGALNTTRLFRDPSAWYHIVLQLDTTQSTAADRIKLYINGIKESDFSFTTYPALNFAFRTVSSVYTEIGRNGGAASLYLDGYLADYYFIDGEALDPSRFGKQDADGVWQPISYTGSYGTNGFHLDFADNSTAAALGTDTSGNGNDWTPSGITTDDQVTDTPSVNYATWNPLDWGIASLADGNLRSFNAINSWQSGRGTFGVSSGKWYWEATGVTNYAIVGIATRKANLANFLGADAFGWGYYTPGGYKYNNGTLSAYGASYSGSDVVGIAFDADAGNLTFYKNGVSQGLAFSGITGETYFPAVSVYNGSIEHNFGQRPFAYTPPTGFQALNSSNLPAPTITDGKEHFQPVLYTGNGTSQTVRGLEFQPDFVWIKNRSATDNNNLLDAVRGATEELESNTTDAEVTNSDGLTAFNSNGFTVGADVKYNTSGENFVAWNWNAGGSTVTNTDGTITSQVRANTDAGFSIVSYTGTGSAGATVGHGLSSAPEMVVVKGRNTALDWAIWHSAIGTTSYLVLNKTNAVSSPDPSVFNGLFSSSVFSIGNWSGINGNTNTYIAYCFAGVDGFSKFGSYTGNGSADGPFVYTGFRPAFVMFKRTDTIGNWAMLDSYRNAYNIVDERLFADLPDAASTLFGVCDFTSNGFKFRTNAGSTNASGGTYIYMAFAENPFQLSRAR